MCCVAGCKSGYATAEASGDRKISFFSFPHDHKLREKCIKNCHRENSLQLSFLVYVRSILLTKISLHVKSKGNY